jgi:hypothetical protein
LNGHLEKNSIELQKAARQKIARKQYEQRKRFTQMQSNKKIAQKRQLDDYQYKQWKSLGETSFEAPFERESSLEGHKRDQSASGCCLSSMPHLDKFDTMTLGGCLHALGSGDHAVLRKQRASQCVNVLPLTADEISLLQLIKQNKLQQLTQTNSNKQTNKSSSGGKSSLDSGKSSSSSSSSLLCSLFLFPDTELCAHVWNISIIKHIFGWYQKKEKKYNEQIKTINDIFNILLKVSQTYINQKKEDYVVLDWKTKTVVPGHILKEQEIKKRKQRKKKRLFQISMGIEPTCTKNDMNKYHKESMSMVRTGNYLLMPEYDLSTDLAKTSIGLQLPTSDVFGWCLKRFGATENEVHSVLHYLHKERLHKRRYEKVVMEITMAERSSKGRSGSGKDRKDGGVKMYEEMDVKERREYVNGIEIDDEERKCVLERPLSMDEFTAFLYNAKHGRK